MPRTNRLCELRVEGVVGRLGLTAQNLCDQAARLEKSLGSVKGMMDRQIGRGNDTRIENKEESETENNLCNGD